MHAGGSLNYYCRDRSTLYIHVTRVCRTRSASRLSRPGAGYPRSEGSGAKFEVYLGIAIFSCQSPKSRTGRYADATPSPLSKYAVSLWSSLPLTGDRIIGLGLANALKHTYTLQHNPRAVTWLSTRAVYRCSTCAMHKVYIEPRT